MAVKISQLLKFLSCWFFQHIDRGFMRVERSRGEKRRNCSPSCCCWEKLVFRPTCWLLLLQGDSSLELRVDAGRNDGRRELSQVGQHALTQGAHISLSQLALCTMSTFRERWLITQGADFIKSRIKTEAAWMCDSPELRQYTALSAPEESPVLYKVLESRPNGGGGKKKKWGVEEVSHSENSWKAKLKLHCCSTAARILL